MIRVGPSESHTENVYKSNTKQPLATSDLLSAENDDQDYDDLPPVIPPKLGDNAAAVST